MDISEVAIALWAVILAIVFASAFTAILLLMHKKFKKSLQVQNDIIAAREKAIKDLGSEVCEIRARFKEVFDAEAEAEKILSNAKDEAWRIREDAQRALSSAADRAKDIVSESAEMGRNIVSDAEKRLICIKAQLENEQQAVDSVLKNARKEAESLIKAAKHEAEALTKEIGRKIQDSIDYENAVKALRNKIEGYGDEYLVPMQTLLDDLAEDFGFTEAGQALKRSREYARELVKTGGAATCEYVEEYRRKTAIAFVLDAFNGKIDSIQSRMRNDNVGKMQQAAKDAFSLVNANGKAFRDARIQAQYLVARLEEIKWGAAAIELRERAREEQRELKEQAREEERARREYERALREALKREESAKIALEKARLAYEKAKTDRERQQLDERIKEFEAKLEQAKADGEKAISMAQLTKSGHVYILSNVGSFGETVFKIGMTRRLDPQDRVRELGGASVPFPFDIHAMIYAEDAPSLENTLHNLFNLQRVNKINFRKEFFCIELGKIHSAIQNAGVAAQFTLVAQALQYRESKAIEKLPLEEQAKILSGAVRAPLERLRERILGEGEEDIEEN